MFERGPKTLAYNAGSQYPVRGKGRIYISYQMSQSRGRGIVPYGRLGVLLVSCQKITLGEIMAKSFRGDSTSGSSVDFFSSFSSVLSSAALSSLSEKMARKMS